jgi:TetR/AcrR family transcriptional repressor of mexJK operon
MIRSTTTRRAAGRPPATAVAEVNAALLQKAAEVFTEMGFAASSMTEIAKRAGTSRQTLYARFPNKTTLFEGLMESRAADMLSNISTLLTGGRMPSEVLQLFGERLVGQFINTDLQSLHRVAIAEAMTFPYLATFFFQKGPERGKKLLMGYLEKQTALGVLVIPDIECAAEQFVGSLVGAINLRATLLQPQRLSDEVVLHRWVRTAVLVFLSAYHPSETTQVRVPVRKIRKL